MQSRAIADYGLVGDGNTAALIGRDGSLAWLCWPRFDSEPVFASLLGSDDNGIWTVSPAGQFRTARQYRPDTLILESRFDTESGTALLTDFMPYQGAPQALIRRLRGIDGTVKMQMRFAPRFECGRQTPRYLREQHGLRVCGKDAVLMLQATKPELLKAEEPAWFEIAKGDEIAFVLTNADLAAADLAAYPQTEETRCEAFWRSWIAQCTYTGPWREPVARSLIVLKALLHAPSGGFVAAPTSSLPERMGGGRNWDYRYCWLRDSTFAVLAFLNAGFHEEAGAWVKWLVHAVDPEKERAHIFYSVVPHSEIDEFEAPWLGGFNGSRPVRFGNDARHQLQLGVYGEVMDTLLQWRSSRENREPGSWQQECGMLRRLEGLIDRPDSGIWEQRGHLECFTESRALAWAAFDRGLKTAERFGFEKQTGWVTQRARLHNEVCLKGYDPGLESFSRAYGSHSLDASNLLLAIVGFLPAGDPRILGTVRAVRRHLSAGPFVYRYDAERENDGIGGAEGAFLPCSCWLADNLILQRQEDAAAAIFESLLGAGNDLGLYSEEYDVSAKCLLGNFPQGLTHLSLVHTALNLTGAGPAHQRSKSAN